MSYVPGMTLESHRDKSLIVSGITLSVGHNVPAGTDSMSEGLIVGLRNRDVGVITPDAGNTGSGVLAGLALGKYTDLGHYTVVFTSGTDFSVSKPDGGLYQAGTGASFTSDHVNFTVSGSPAAGDKFTLEILAGDNGVVPLDETAVDGSQFPFGVLNCDVDASSIAKKCDVLVMGIINSNEVDVAGSGWSVAQVKQYMLDHGRALYFEASINY